jgi:acetoin utilization protein AcuC
VHESGRALFPGTGFPSEIGGPSAVGSAANLALPPGTGDDAWLRAFHGVVPALVREFAPEILVTQQGCDTHLDDPLAHLALSVDGQRMTYEALHELAHEVCDGRWVALGGGGYSWIEVVPRAWSHLIGVAVGAPVDPSTPLPESWRTFVTDRLRVPAPELMTDGRAPTYRTWESGYDPADPIDAAVLRTREAVYPWHGLNADPYHGF